jgi:uncharacterized membrane protein YkvA (DUF1232 family)
MSSFLLSASCRHTPSPRGTIAAMSRSTMRRWRTAAGALKGEALALYFALRHPRTPKAAKVLAAAVVAYAFSPVDLIPDFIPLLGYVDDLVLLPVGIAAAMRLIPPDVMAECRAQARRTVDRAKPVIWTAAVIIIAFWVVVVALLVRALFTHFAHA